MFYDRKGEIWCARKGSPLVGHAREGFCASDPTALLEFTRDVWFMDDDEIAEITKKAASSSTSRESSMTRNPCTSTDAAMTNRGDYAHFMLKEIHEQPDVVTHTPPGPRGQRRGGFKPRA